jgi:hypothetical protein
MAMVCPACSTTHDQRLHCPVCGARLVYRGPDRRRGGGRDGKWTQSPWARVIIGLLLAQGLFHGLQQLVAAVWLSMTGVGVVEAAGPAAGALLQGAQLFGLLLGGLIAGSGQRSGPLLGALVGVWNGVLCLVLQPSTGVTLTTVSLYGQPLLQTACGALAGWLGCVIWKPLPMPTLPGAAQTVRKPTLGGERSTLFAGQISWFRVILGTALAIAGILSANTILQTVLAADARLSTADLWHDQMLTLEIKALAILAGAGLAGANTANGLKQGLCVAVPIILLLLAQPVARASTGVVTLSLLATFVLCVIGGWFGSQLLPPVVKVRRGLGPLV